MKFNHITGLIAATFSPFSPTGELHTDIIPEYARMLRINGIKGVFVNGTTGEGASLMFDEKKALIAAWAPYQAPDFKVMAMVSGTSQQEGIALATYAREHQLYGIAVNAPYYIKTGSVEALVEFIRPIAAAAPELALYFYHIPILTGVNLSMTSFLQQAGVAIPNFAGIKYTHNDLMEFNQCLRFDNYRYDILWGWDEMLLAGLAMGAMGGVGSTYNFAAPLYHDIIRQFEAGNLAMARSLQEKSIDFIALYPHFGGTAAGKAILGFLGIEAGELRPPGKSLSNNQKNDLFSALQSQGFFDYCAKV